MIRDNATLLWWCAILVLGVPLVVVLLGEVSLRLAERESRYVRVAELARSVLVPSAIVVIVTRAILALDEDRAISRITMTILLIAVGYVGFVFLGYIASEKRPGHWENRIPGLFRILLRVGFIIIPLSILFDTWGIDITSNLGALGIGGVAIAFALQDAIGNVVSGVLLIIDRPFTVGDWIEVDGAHGEVIDVSWRSTRIRVDRDVVILPNITLSNSSIRNLTALDPSHETSVDFAFDYDDRPSVVKQMLLDVALDNDELSTVDPPEVNTVAFGDSSITYRLRFTLDQYHSDTYVAGVRDQLRTTVLYAHSRYGLTMPYPTVMHLGSESLDDDASERITAAREFLTWNATFASLPDDIVGRLSSVAAAKLYATSETILSPRFANDQLYLIVAGQVVLEPASAFESASRTTGRAGEESESDGRHSRGDDAFTLRVGDVFGEEALVSHIAGTWIATAATDVELLALSASTVQSIAEQHPRFSAALNEVMIERQRRHRELSMPSDATENVAALDLTTEANGVDARASAADAGASTASGTP